jgi:3-hydroxyacyl-CoA dehydrogenase/3-hydroxy-2-methylbutyryl-CoA dehydrogenase
VKLDGSVAVVTGGLSGLGRAAVSELMARGAQVAIIDVSEPQAGAGDGAEGAVLFCKGDVTNTADLDRAFTAIGDTWGRLDLCVNCAGVHIPSRLVSRAGVPVDLGGLRRSLEVNVVGLVDVMSRSALLMLENPMNDEGERGVIVNVGSIAAIEGPIGSISYSGSKGAVMAMTLPVARELGSYGIRVACIAPGAMDTPMIGSIDGDLRAALAKDNAFPPRLGRPSEFGSLVCTVAENVFLNATTLRLDGGARMGPRLPARVVFDTERG